ncbi:ferredoxin III, nif-specific [Candidatus Magnetaquicoccus inordinatus]|uniref:ferredoxin III, nif-specific n=1 Tax=Candidatus Magnetaquicoccus inordinatus TaxID=2496818 RepID=UPI00102B3AF7|nr:ferredoxin III, nif-specific [Candidatus Magnetaquicoccus inordinatus]
MTSTTRNGNLWIPEYLLALDHKRCIGCGRCYKACSRSVLALVERESLHASEEDEEDGFADEPRMVMTIANAGDCIGCGACARVCPKKCQTHAPLAA